MNDEYKEDPFADAIGGAEEIRDPLEDLVEKTRSDPGAAFTPEALEGLLTLMKADRAAFETLRAQLKEAGCRVTALDEALKRLAAAGGPAQGPQLQGRALDLPEPEPWPEPVDGQDLVAELARAIGSHVVLPSGGDQVVVLWVLHVHAFTASSITPRLAIVSPERRCGKSTLLKIIRCLVPKPLPASNVTAAAVFRTIEVARPTLLIDEADTFLPENEELRGVVNSGHADDGNVLRLVGDSHEPRQFSTWAPVAIATIGQLPGTISDRSITIQMKRRRRSDPSITRLRKDRPGPFPVLASRCARWAADHLAALREADPEIPESLNDRAADNWRPLLAIADAVGGECARKAHSVALAQGEGMEDDSIGVMLLEDIRSVFTAKNVDRIPSEDLCGALAGMEDRPWPEQSRGKPISQAKLAEFLRNFDILPKTIRFPEKLRKGYLLDAFTDAFSRYLPPLPTVQTPPDPPDPPSGAVTPEQPQDSAGNEQIRPVTPGSDVTDQKPGNPSVSADCYSVTAPEGWSGEKEEYVPPEDAAVTDGQPEDATATDGQGGHGDHRKPGSRPPAETDAGTANAKKGTANAKNPASSGPETGPGDGEAETWL